MDEVMFDAEHFFDGYRPIPIMRWPALGGGESRRTLAGAVRHQRRDPAARDRAHRGRSSQERSRAIASASTRTTTPRTPSNTLAAVRAGVRQVQGTINGLGERCGNAKYDRADP